MHNKKFTVLIVLAALVLVLGCVMVAVALLWGGSEEASKNDVVSQVQEQIMNETSSEAAESTGEGVAASEEESESSESSDESSAVEGDSSSPGSGSDPSSDSSINETISGEGISFPYTIPGTNLVIERLDSYDGIFLEDGSDQSVEGISAMVLTNTGSTGVEYVNITMNQNGEQLQYTGTAIPAGSTIVIQESGASSYSTSSYTDCTANVADMQEFEMSSSQVKVEENEDGSLQVTNLTGETIPCVRVFYKFAIEEGEIYVGGITYTAKVTELEAGESRQIAPSHYAGGSSEVMMVRTYETAD